MSAAGRSERGGGGLDRFDTPQDLAEALVRRLPSWCLEGGIIEGSCGGGAFISALLDRGVRPEQVLANDINPAVIDDIQRRFPGVRTRVGRFEDLTRRDVHEALDGLLVRLVVGNPPYNVASDHLGHALYLLTLGRPALIDFLLRSNFVGPDCRYELLAEEALPAMVNPLTPRPSFTGDGDTDATEYSGFTWEAHAFGLGRSAQPGFYRPLRWDDLPTSEWDIRAIRNDWTFRREF